MESRNHLLHFVPVRQRVAGERIEDVAREVRSGLQAIGFREHVRPGMRVALTAGSRGISVLGEVLRTLIEELRGLAAEPFLVPAMGSHGGGTADGQRQVIEGYGLTAESLGVPICSSMETVVIGETAEGMPVYFDAFAAAADGIILVNRIKEHTAFRGRWESGLLKMAAVGLGKANGAAEIHNWGVRDAMPAAARVALDRMPILAGIGIVENGFHEPVRIAVLPRERIEDEEPALLELARQLTPRIPLAPLDLLVVREMGKEISGTGMDLNVIGMWRRTGGAVEPEFNVVAVLDLTDKTHGNAIGVGHADLITQRLRDKIDLAATYTNCLTSHNLAGGKIPITLPTDRDVFDAGLAGIDSRRARVVVIRNTLDLELLWVSEALLESVARTPTLQQIGPPQPIRFDHNGDLHLPEIR
ncbi:MAG: hypothetical protein AMXMBFR80_28770 [Dehalococcoidia bacterium]